MNLGDAYRALGQKDKAQATYQQAISVGYKQLQTNPQDSEVMAEIALSYANVGNVKEAETLIGRARAQDKKDVNIAYMEVQIAALTGKSSQAVTLLADGSKITFPPTTPRTTPISIASTTILSSLN